MTEGLHHSKLTKTSLFLSMDIYAKLTMLT